MSSNSETVTTVETTLGDEKYQLFEWKIHNADKFCNYAISKIKQKFGPTEVDRLRFELIITRLFDHGPSTITFRIQLCRLGDCNWRYYPGKFKFEVKLKDISPPHQFVMDFDDFSKHEFQLFRDQIKKGSTLDIYFEYFQNEIKRGPPKTIENEGLSKPNLIETDFATKLWLDQESKKDDDKSESGTNESIEIVDSLSDSGSNECVSLYEIKKLEDLLKEERIKYAIVQERLNERDQRIAELESIIREIDSFKNGPSLIEMKTVETKLIDCGNTLDRIQAEIEDPERQLIAMKELGKLMDKLKVNMDEFGTVEYGPDVACYKRLELNVLHDKILTRLDYAIEKANQNIQTYQRQQQKSIKELIEKATLKAGSLSADKLREIQHEIQKKMAERTAKMCNDEKGSKKIAQLAKSADNAIQELQTRLNLFAQIDIFKTDLTAEIRAIERQIASSKHNPNSLIKFKEYQIKLETKKNQLLGLISKPEIAWNYQELILNINNCQKQLTDVIFDLSNRLNCQGASGHNEVYY